MPKRPVLKLAGESTGPRRRARLRRETDDIEESDHGQGFGFIHLILLSFPPKYLMLHCLRSLWRTFSFFPLEIKKSTLQRRVQHPYCHYPEFLKLTFYYIYFQFCLCQSMFFFHNKDLLAHLTQTHSTLPSTPGGYRSWLWGAYLFIYKLQKKLHMCVCVNLFFI